jgi:GH25 family lysozyme M1 (1,4-beta-N-acetylmuramidase)
MKKRTIGKRTGCMGLAVMLAAAAIFGKTQLGQAASTAWTKVNGVFVNSAGNEIEGAVLKGIDVSYHNEDIDWEQVKNSDIDYAIIRCGYGQDFESQDDKKWKEYADACVELGIPFGTYLYSYATTVSAAKSEAEHVLRVIEGYPLTYPVYYDMEDSKQSSTTAKRKAQMAEAFCSIIEEAGYQVGIYANTDWFTNKLTNSYFDTCDKWVAQYNATCKYTGSYRMWQCTSSGSVPGISTKVDLNFWFDEAPVYQGNVPSAAGNSAGSTGNLENGTNSTGTGNGNNGESGSTNMGNEETSSTGTGAGNGESGNIGNAGDGELNSTGTDANNGEFSGTSTGNGETNGTGTENTNNGESGGTNTGNGETNGTGTENANNGESGSTNTGNGETNGTGTDANNGESGSTNTGNGETNGTGTDANNGESGGTNTGNGETNSTGTENANNGESGSTNTGNGETNGTGTENSGTNGTNTGNLNNEESNSGNMGSENDNKADGTSKKLTISQNSLTLSYGGTSVLTASQEVTWASADKNIVKVSAKGKVTPVAVGETTITATAADSSEQTAECSVLITKPIKDTVISAIPNQTFTGKKICPEVTVTDGETTLVKGTDYKVTYTDNTAKGTASIQIKGKGYYTGTAQISFQIVAKEKLAAPVVSSISSENKTVTLKWKKVSKASGYEIYRATKKNGEYELKKKVQKNSKVSYQDKKLTKGKKYYYKIRAYRIVNGKKQYSSYTKVNIKVG